MSDLTRIIVAPRTLVTALTLVAIGVGAVFAADAIESRRALMKAQGAAFGGVLVKMAKGETAYDAAAAKAAAETLIKTSKSFDIAALFPKGTETGGDTAAAPKIWEDRAGFEAALAVLRKTVETQAPNVEKGLDGLKTAVGDIGKACKGCHDGYRINKT